jgi:putative Mg2+ transporter-C (MgtC) family protein
MSPNLTWQTAALRLALTIAAGAFIGVNRGERGHAAGLRTTILVCVAASIAMLQVNLLLPLAGHAEDSFVKLDLMRLPQGILAGIGFIGAGAILRRDNAIVGVTTAATMWAMTVIGLCFGGGQLALGGVGTAIVGTVLWGMKRIDLRLPRERRARLTIVSRSAEGVTALVQGAVAAAHLDASYRSGTYECDGRAELHFLVRWRGSAMLREPSEALAPLREHPAITCVRWEVEASDVEESV